MGEKKISFSEENKLDSLYEDYWSYLTKTASNLNNLYEHLDTPHFIRFLSLRNHKSRGTDVENRVKLKNNWRAKSPTHEAGDLINHNNENIEIKSSIVTPNENSMVTLRGFRPWETNIHYYVAVVLDIRQFYKDPIFYIYQFKPDVVTAKNHFKPYNQSKNARAGNTNVPLGISFNIGDQTFKDWTKYRTDSIKF